MLKKEDTKLINELRKNGRKGPKEMSESIGTPISTIYEKVQNHLPIIKRYTCLLDYSKLGYSIRATFIFKVKHREQALLFLMQNNNVNNLWKINGGYDFLLEGVFKDLLEVEELKDELQNKCKATRMQVHYMVEELKREQFILLG